MSSKDRLGRTRKDPFKQDWAEVKEMLGVMPELRACALFEYLQEKYPGRYQEGQLRTLERRVSSWKARHGEEKEVFFAQIHRPGEYMQLDWMCCNKLRVLVNGEPFDHLLCHCVLPYSKWEWARVCFSESLLSLRLGLQDALFELGGTPETLQIDNCSAATHELGRGLDRRSFTDGFLSVLKHFEMKPHAIAVGKANQNGSVEKMHDHLRRRLGQALLLRGSRQFESPAEYELFVTGQLCRANKLRTTKVSAEKGCLTALPTTRLLGFEEEMHRVGTGATVRVRKRLYSVPSRLIGRQLRCCVYLDRIELFDGATKVHEMERVYAEKAGMRWQDLIASMVQKPGAFARYRYREVFLPTVVFEETCRSLVNEMGRWQGELEFLQILNHFRHLDNQALEAKLRPLLEAGDEIRLECLRRPSLGTQAAFDMPPFEVQLAGYDAFCKEVKHG